MYSLCVYKPPSITHKAQQGGVSKTFTVQMHTLSLCCCRTHTLTSVAIRMEKCFQRGQSNVDRQLYTNRARNTHTDTHFSSVADIFSYIACYYCCFWCCCIYQAERKTTIFGIHLLDCDRAWSRTDIAFSFSQSVWIDANPKKLSAPFWEKFGFVCCDSYFGWALRCGANRTNLAIYKGVRS